ncbi:lymphocyte function-associated antigen 3-like [Centropristis striata]|uniref:lymphocyte function-associated antigen 3-like n=1 Tax=Centropristis striata TaxID=184440 RepID=UPI0027E03674|nr:lymphocyte function-associated antigen 3-like [Centropristis striata]
MSRSETSMMWAVWLGVFLAAAESAETEIYGRLGGEVVLKPGVIPQTEAITQILWKIGPDIAADWENNELDVKDRFITRGHLNTSSGELTITGLRRNDSGVYTSEINYKVSLTSPTRLTVISPVPKPTVTKSCNADESSCTLTCAGDVTGAGMVTYTWRSDNNETSSSREQLISKDDDMSVKEFTCQLKNPVSQESSEPFSNPFPNPFTPPAMKLNFSTGLTVFLCLLIAVVLLVCFHRCKAGEWFFNKDNMPWEADFWRKNGEQSRDATDSNGTTAREKGQTDEETPMT